MRQALFHMGQQLYLHAPSAYRPVYAMYKAWSDRRERALLNRIIRPGMTVVDVGANIGIYARFLARRVGPAGQVFAFEPEPRNFRMLERTVHAEPSVRAIQAAVGDTAGKLRLFVADDFNVDHHTYDAGDGRRSVDVEAVVLDEFFVAGQAVHAIKIDVQGAELSVLRGARRLVSDNPGIQILMEYWPYGLRRAGASGGAVLDLLDAMHLRYEEIAAQPSADLRSMPEDIARYTNIRAWRREA